MRTFQRDSDDDARLGIEELGDLARAIIAAREEAGLSRREVAEAMQTDYRSIARLESGMHLPSTRSLQRFARVTEKRLRIVFDPLPERSGLAPAAMKGSHPVPISADPRNPHAFLSFVASRRRLLGAAAVGTASTFGERHAYAGTQQTSPAATPETANGVQPDGTWSFTDDRGMTITLPEQPRRIFADLQAAAALWDFGIRPVAIAAGSTAPGSAAWGNVDPAIENINSDGSEVDVEKLMLVDADIYVTLSWQPDDPEIAWGLGFEDMETYKRVNDVVPIVGISATGFADDSARRFAELSGTLGIDLESPTLVEAKTAFEAAIDAMSTTAAERSDISVLYAYVGSGEEWYAASPRMWADLAFYERLGMQFAPVVPDEYGYWAALSREQALTYPSDIFLNSTRDGMLTPAQLQADPLFGQHPAIKASQIGGWNQDFILSYQGLTTVLEELTALLQQTKDIV